MAGAKLSILLLEDYRQFRPGDSYAATEILIIAITVLK